MPWSAGVLPADLLIVCYAMQFFGPHSQLVPDLAEEFTAPPLVIRSFNTLGA